MGQVVVQDGAVLPKAVIDQAEADDRMQEAEIAAQKVVEAAQAAAPAPVTPVPVAAPVAAPAALAPPSASEQALRQQLLMEQQKNQSLLGRIDAVAPQAAAQTAELKAQIARLEAQIVAVPPQPVIPAHLAHLTPEERELHAGQGLPVEARMAQGLAEQQTQKAAQQIAQQTQANAEANAALSQRVAETEQAAAEERQQQRTHLILQQVEQLGTPAVSLNSDPGFNLWIDRIDPRSTTGATYKERGWQAMDRGDVHAVNELMQEYLGSGLAIDPRVTAQIKPATSSVVAPVIKQPEPETIMEHEATAFLNDKALNRCHHPNGAPMTQTEIDEISAKIDRAMAEGRIQA